MPGKITVNIELKPYLVKFLLHCSMNHRQPLQFSRKSAYKISLIRKVSNYYSQASFPVHDREAVMDYFRPSAPSRENVCIILPFNRRKNIASYNYLSRSNKIEFRKEVREDFNLAFHRYLVRHLRRNILRTEILKSFMEKYGLTEDDIKFESLYRYSSRLLEEYD